MNGAFAAHTPSHQNRTKIDGFIVAAVQPTQGIQGDRAHLDEKRYLTVLNNDDGVVIEYDLQIVCGANMGRLRRAPNPNHPITAQGAPP